MELPENVKSLLWDVSIASVDTIKHADYIIKKILLIGDFPETKWAIKTYGWDKVKQVALSSSQVRPEVKSFYSKINL